MDKLVATLGITNLSKSQVSRMAADLDEQVKAFRTRRLDESGPFAFVAADALTMKVRENGRVINAVVLVATGVTAAARATAAANPDQTDTAITEPVLPELEPAA